MNLYERLVTEAQMNYSRYYGAYMSGKSPYKMSDKKKLPYKEQIHRLAEKICEADCIIVGGASGLSAAGGGDFYYADTPSYREYFKPFAEKYHFHGAFHGMQYPFPTDRERWGYLTTFLHTTITAPVRKPYIDLNAILQEKDFHILTTNQDTQFVKLYPDEKVSEIQGDHRFFQCSQQCCDDVWDAVQLVEDMYTSMNGGTSVPEEMIPRCPHCDAEAFPWVRGYGNFLQGKKYQHEYQKMSDYLQNHLDKKILFLELGVGRMTPMFIQEPFWNLTASLPDAFYVGVNNQYDLLPAQIEEKGMMIFADIANVLTDARKIIEGGVLE